MNTASIDALWFRANPGRAYRLRPATQAELAAWPSPPPAGLPTWCIVRASDGAARSFAWNGSPSPHDCDRCLADILTECALFQRGEGGR